MKILLSILPLLLVIACQGTIPEPSPTPTETAAPGRTARAPLVATATRGSTETPAPTEMPTLAPIIVSAPTPRPIPVVTAAPPPPYTPPRARAIATWEAYGVVVPDFVVYVVDYTAEVPCNYHGPSQWSWAGCYFNGGVDYLDGNGERVRVPINTVWIYYTESYYDVLLHEMGHMVGFGHDSGLCVALPSCFRANQPWGDRIY